MNFGAYGVYQDLGIASEFRMGLRRTHCHENEVESAVYDGAGVGR
jgi:hypothetical protein